MRVCLMMIGLLILWIFFIWIFVLLFCKQRKKSRSLKEYKRVFGNEPDVLTLQKWSETGSPYKKTYTRQVQESKKKCASETIVFVGLIRNNGEKAVSFWKPWIEGLGGYFSDYKIIFVENDSQDDTRDWIWNWKKQNEKVHLLCPEKGYNTKDCKLGISSYQKRGDKETKLEKRIEILSILRESYLEEIKTYEGVDFVMVIDWDIQGDLSVEGFFHALHLMRNSSRIDTVAVNSFYQVRNKNWKIFDTFPLISSDVCMELSIPEKKRKMDEKTEKKFHQTFLKNLNPIFVDSAFGGMALYKCQSWKEKEVHYYEEDNDIQARCPYQCEHSRLHEKLNVVVDPWFIFLVAKNMN